MMSSDIPYIRHILDAIERIEEYLQGVFEEDFHHVNSRMKVYQGFAATLRQ